MSTANAARIYAEEERRALELIEKIRLGIKARRAIIDHRGHAIHWGHIGDIGQLRHVLQPLHDQMYSEGEFDPSGYDSERDRLRSAESAAEFELAVEHVLDMEADG